MNFKLPCNLTVAKFCECRNRLLKSDEMKVVSPNDARKTLYQSPMHYCRSESAVKQSQRQGFANPALTQLCFIPTGLSKTREPRDGFFLAGHALIAGI
jgi:hypothetical protein